MGQLDVTLEIINDLIEVNGQRIWGYQVALTGDGDTPNLELYGVFEQIVDQGQRFQEALELQFFELAHDLPKRGHPSGTILRAWWVVKALFPETSFCQQVLFLIKANEPCLKPIVMLNNIFPYPLPYKKLLLVNNMNYQHFISNINRYIENGNLCKAIVPLLSYRSIGN